MRHREHCSAVEVLDVTILPQDNFGHRGCRFLVGSAPTSSSLSKNQSSYLQKVHASYISRNELSLMRIRLVSLSAIMSLSAQSASFKCVCILLSPYWIARNYPRTSTKSQTSYLLEKCFSPTKIDTPAAVLTGIKERIQLLVKKKA